MKKIIYLECPQIINNRADLMNITISDWLHSNALNNLVKSFDGVIPNNLSLFELAQWHLKFSDRWDYRKQSNCEDKSTGEKARWLISKEQLSDLQLKCIDIASIDLGLKLHKDDYYHDYDYILVLGGAKLSCLLRTKMAYQLISSGKINNVKTVYFLGSSRPIAVKEKEATDTYAHDA